MIGLIAATANGRRNAAHLAGAWSDTRLYDGNAKEALDREFFRITIAAENLYCSISTAVSGFRGKDLGHGGLLRELIALLRHPRSAIGQEPRRLGFGCHIGKHPLNSLKTRDRLPELLALPRV